MGFWAGGGREAAGADRLSVLFPGSGGARGAAGREGGSLPRGLRLLGAGRAAPAEGQAAPGRRLCLEQGRPAGEGAAGLAARPRVDRDSLPLRKFAGTSTPA